MAKIVIQHDEDPGIAVILTEVEPGTPGAARGWYGTCTECGGGTHKWNQGPAIQAAKEHVDRHEGGL